MYETVDRILHVLAKEEKHRADVDRELSQLCNVLYSKLMERFSEDDHGRVETLLIDLYNVGYFHGANRMPKNGREAINTPMEEVRKWSKEIQARIEATMPRKEGT